MCWTVLRTQHKYINSFDLVLKALNYLPRPQTKLRIEELLDERVANERQSMEVGISAEEEDCETIEDTDAQESQGLVDVEEIEVEIEKYKKESQEFRDADGKIYANCDNCGKTLTKQSLAKHKRLVRCNPQKPIPSKVDQEKEEKEEERIVPNGSSKCNECDSVNTNMRRHMRRVHGDVKTSKSPDTGEEEVKKVSEFVSSTDADIIDMKNKLENKDDKEDFKDEEVGNKCSRCPKTFAHKKNVARHERTHDDE